MPFLRLSNNDGTWSDLETQWSEECEGFDEDLTNFAAHLISHARSIAAEESQSANYGVFGLRNGVSFDALAHFNRAGLPGTSGWTLRVLWILLSPKFEFSDIQQEDFGRTVANIVNGAVAVARGHEMRCQHVKIHIGAMADREFFRGMAAAMSDGHAGMSFAVKGNWLHIDNVTTA